MCTLSTILYLKKKITGKTEIDMSGGPARSKVQKSIVTVNQIVHNLAKNCSTVVDSIVSMGKLFQSFIVLGKKSCICMN